MAIEGPLRELGIHDVFQLLDLSRKTGSLRVTSDLRGDEGTVRFEAGRVVHASVRSNPATVEDLLVQSDRVTAAQLARAREAVAAGHGATNVGEELVRTGAIARRELERQQRLQIESVVFELMSWQEGFFSFEDRPPGEPAPLADIRVSTESLLMEGARRIDEWSRIADRIPSLAVVPTLAAVNEDHQAQLDLLPYEWEVLAHIDGTRDLRAIAQAVGRAEFDIARTVYGLASTGVVELNQAERRRSGAVRAAAAADEHLSQARASLAAGQLDSALASALAARNAEGDRTDARLLVARVLSRLGRNAEALEELRRTMQVDPITPEVHRDLAFAAAREGDLATAAAGWDHYRRSAPGAADIPQVNEAEQALRRFHDISEAMLRE
jgi:hypothetical protein